MNKTVVIPALLAVGVFIAPGAAGAKGKPEPAGKSEAVHGKSHKCTAHKVGYVVSGTLAAPATLTQTAGAETPADTSDDRYSGTLSVTVTKTNNHAKGVTSPQTYVLSDIRLRDGVTATPPAGTAVKVIAKITKISKKCDQTGAGIVTPRKATLTIPKTTA
ncbi:MAG TPA: hypothetical protein VK501_19845 [Baekduia sp.]|uniref:hypothetical protein n=1 Tax=Baekduia sp. TaxID=2600305 RepID=UPI002CD2422E|nr:hypothetical protein [Baekduia sp.]HMJ36166.1 hypothetical protein [Baekduia sp.]